MAMPLSLVAPELRRATKRMSALPMPIGYALGRGLLRRLTALVPPADADGVQIETIGGTPPVRLYRPRDRRSDAALLWVHGGGYIIGSALIDDRFCIETARALGIVVASVDYRLAPEHPFPAPHDDCHAAWRWLVGQADPLGLDPARIAIGGQSAGGGLAAGLVQRLRDEGGVQPAAQWLFCPMIDDRTAADRTLDRVGHRLWHNRRNRIGWRCYLGDASAPPPYAAPARRSDLAGLPPTWIGVGTIDLFHIEDADYAARLEAAGVATTFVEVDAAPHGFEAWAAESEVARRYMAEAREWLRDALD